MAHTDETDFFSDRAKATSEMIFHYRLNEDEFHKCSLHSPGEAIRWWYAYRLAEEWKEETTKGLATILYGGVNPVSGENLLDVAEKILEYWYEEAKDPVKELLEDFTKFYK